MPPIRVLPFVLAFTLVLAPKIVTRAAVPDEGQWLPTQVREMDWDALKKRGLTLTKDEFWHPTEGGVLTAAVQIGGCSASFCSPDGLVVTNHHCGFGAVERLSTPENNRLQNGYAASTQADELPAAGMFVLVVRRIENVTERIQAAAAKAVDDFERAENVEAEIRALVAEGQKEPNTVCSVASFLNGTEYHLYYRTRLDDVRLVYAPPRSVGEFGGETDNWEWPRHTGDFMFFRAYAAPDGSPRAHSKDNVPFKPKHWLRTAKEGPTEGDLVMVLGYPGRTQRYLTSEGVRVQQESFYPLRYELTSKTIEILEEASKESPEKALRLSSPIKSVANVQKNALGMIKGLARNGTVARKLAEEKEFAAWVAADPARKEKYGDVLEEMLTFERRQGVVIRRDSIIGALTGAQTPLLNALTAHFDRLDRAEGEGAGGGDRARRGLLSETIAADWESVQLPVIAAAMDAMRRLPESERFAKLDAFFNGSGPGFEGAKSWFGTTQLTSADVRSALTKADPNAPSAAPDPLSYLAKALSFERREMNVRQKTAAGRRLDLGRRWIAAQQEWRGKAFYPDANSTLRVSIATVKGYAPRDGVFYPPRTTVRGLIEKHVGAEPFDAPASLLAAAPARMNSRFADKTLGDVPVNFLSDGDTTGGNSGSCVINGRGELVGLNFDRVFENVSGDFGWSPERSRNIVCDIRFVLWNLEAVLPAPGLLKELGF